MNITFQDFKTVDGANLIDLPERRCWIISEGTPPGVTERFIHSIDPWQDKYAICAANGTAYYTANRPETCLYADRNKAWQEIIRRANINHQTIIAHAVAAMQEPCP